MTDVPDGASRPAVDGLAPREDPVDPIRVSALRKEYDHITALDGIDLTIRPGGIHCLVGPNGSGKSTLFRILLGLTRPSAGTVSIPETTVGVGFQEPVCYPDLTVAENLRVFGRLMDAPGADWRERLRESLGLDRVAHREAAALSGGYRKKLDLALSLLKRPRYLLLDEPLADLDDVSRDRLLAFLSAYARAGNAVFVSTHRIDAFAATLDRLTVLSHGRIVDDQPREALTTGDDSIADRYAHLIEATSE